MDLSLRRDAKPVQQRPVATCCETGRSGFDGSAGTAVLARRHQRVLPGRDEELIVAAPFPQRAEPMKFNTKSATLSGWSSCKKCPALSTTLTSLSSGRASGIQRVKADVMQPSSRP